MSYNNTFATSWRHVRKVGAHFTYAGIITNCCTFVTICIPIRFLLSFRANVNVYSQGFWHLCTFYPKTSILSVFQFFLYNIDDELYS